MLILDKDKYFIKGNNKIVFLLDEFPNKCLKISTKERLKELRRSNKHWYKKIRPLSCFSDNLKDIKGYRIIDKKKAYELYKYIPNYYGVIQTNLGDGLLIEYINDSMSIFDYIKKYGFNNKLQQEIKDLFKILYEYNIQIRDPNLGNFLVKIVNDNNDIELKLIEGVSNAQLIPLADWIKFIGRIQTRKRFCYFIEYLCKHFNELENEIISFEKHMLQKVLVYK